MSDAKEQVHEFHEQLAKEYGITPDMLRKMVVALIHLVEKEERNGRYADWAAKSVIVAIVGGMATGIVFAIKAVWHSLLNGHH